MARNKRRANSEGSITQLTDGRWQARITLPDGRRKAYYGRTRSEANAKLVAGMSDLQKGLLIAGERLTVGQFLDRWMEDNVLPTVRKSTYHSYRQHVEQHLKPALGRVSLAKLQPGHVQRMMASKAEEGLAATTIQRVRATLRRALNIAVRQGLIARNVATLVDPPKAERREFVALDPEQARQFCESVKEHRLEPLFTVAMTVGLRQGELLGLRWSDLDLESGMLTVRHQLQRIEGRYELVPPKSGKSRRTLKIGSATVAALRRQRANQNRDRLLAGDRWANEGLVFTTQSGRPMSNANVTHTFQRALAAAGMPRMRFHDLRHTCASLLLAQGVPLKVVAEQLGHSQISLTADTYSHVTPGMQADAAARMDAVFDAGRGR